MKNYILAIASFVVMAALGFGVGQLIWPAKPLGVPSCAAESKAQIKRDGGLKFEVKQTVEERKIVFDVTANVTCPMSVAAFVRLDTTTLPDWQLGSYIEAAYLPAKVVKTVDGKARFEFTPETSPAIEIIPSGKYMAMVYYTTAKQNARHTEFFAKEFGLEYAGADIKQIEFDYKTTKVDSKEYNQYLTNFLRLADTASRQGLTRSNLGDFEKAFGKAEIEKQGENTLYTFPKVQHSFLVNADGKPVKIKRYSFEGEVQ